MSMLVDGTDGVMNYVVGDERKKIILAAFNSVQQATKGLKALETEGHGNLVLQNITHPKCPDWIIGIVKSDAEYCERRADGFQNRADSARKQADALLAEAARFEGLAQKWREAKEDASATAVPGM